MESVYYNPNKLKTEEEDEYHYMQDEDLLEKIERGDFHIGPSYENKPDETLICKECKNDKFIVGQGSYHTSIKCPNCGWEYCVHDG